MAKYAVNDSGLQDIQTKTVSLLCTAGELGDFDTNAVTIPSDKLNLAVVERIVVFGTDGEAIEVSISMDNQIVIGSVSTPVSDETIVLVHIKLK